MTRPAAAAHDDAGPRVVLTGQVERVRVVNGDGGAGWHCTVAVCRITNPWGEIAAELTVYDETRPAMVRMNPRQARAVAAALIAAADAEP